MERGGARVSFQLAVADLNATEAFYGGILELPVQRAFTARGAPEHLILKHEDWELIIRRGVGGYPCPSRYWRSA